MTRLISFVAAALVVVTSFIAYAGTAAAHERRTVGPYQLVVGWLNEPAYVGLMNSLDLRVTDTRVTPAKAVEGLEKTLTVDLRTGGLAPLPLTVTARFGAPGAYNGYVMPTATGTYIFTIKGKIESLDVNEKFESGRGDSATSNRRTRSSTRTRSRRGRAHEASRRHPILDRSDADPRRHRLDDGDRRLVPRGPGAAARPRSAAQLSARNPRGARRRVRPHPVGRHGGGARELRQVEPRIRRSAHEGADGRARHVQRAAGRARQRPRGARYRWEATRQPRRDAGQRRAEHAARHPRRDRRRRVSRVVDRTVDRGRTRDEGRIRLRRRRRAASEDPRHRPIGASANGDRDRRSRAFLRRDGAADGPRVLHDVHPRPRIRCRAPARAATRDRGRCRAPGGQRAPRPRSGREHTWAAARVVGAPGIRRCRGDRRSSQCHRGCCRWMRAAKRSRSSGSRRD